MKNLTLIVFAITCIYNANAQTWTNYHDGYKYRFTIETTDSLIFVGGEIGINVYSAFGEYKYTKFTNGIHYCSDIDNEGNVWFGYSNGIIKFDGEVWEYFHADIPDILSCTSIACDKNNNVWASFGSTSSSEAYLSKFDGVNWQNHSIFGDTISIRFTNEIVIDTNNVVYAGINVNGNDWSYGIVRISETDTTIFHHKNSNCMIACRHSSYLDDENNVWFGGCYNSLYRYDGEAWYSEGDDPILANKSFSAIYKDDADNLWLGTSSGLFVQNEDSWIEYNSENELAYDEIWDIKSDQNNRIWLASNQSNNIYGCLTAYNESEFIQYFPNTFLSEITEITFRNDELWAIGWDGISVMKNGNWQVNYLEESLSDNLLAHIISDSDNNIWVMSPSVLYKIDENNSIDYITHINDNSLNNRCFASYENTIWLNSPPYLYKYENGNWSEIQLTGVLSVYFADIAPINSSDIWVGTSSGAMSFIDNNWHTYTIEDGLAWNLVTDIEIEENKVWFATGRGLSSFDGTTWETFIHDSISIPSYNNNKALFIDKNDHKWVGCSKGLYRYDNYNFHFTQPNDMDETIKFITEDLDGNIWVAGQHGISKYTFAPANIENNLGNKTALESYPNPTTNNLNIELPKEIKNDILEIYSTTGGLVLQQKVQSGTNNINIANLKPGMYLVRLKESGLYGKFVKE